MTPDETQPLPVTVTIEVEMVAFCEPGVIRKVDVPYREFMPVRPSHQLELVFHYGQNEVQSRPFPSVSVGDVIRLHGRRYVVGPVGFRRLDD